MTIYDRISQRLEELELSMRKASLRVGTNAELIRKLLEERSEPREATLGKIAEALETTPEWLRTGVHPVGRPTPATDGFNLLAAVPLEELKGMFPQNMPVLGTASGGAISRAGSFEIEPHVIDVAHRPPALLGVADAYAIRVDGRSMEPEHRHGALRFVNPHLRPMIGDSVIVQERYSEAEPPSAYIGHLLRRTSSQVVLGKLNPVSSIKFENRYVVAVHKIMDMDDLFLTF